MKWFEEAAEELEPGRVYTRSSIVSLLKKNYPYVSPNSYQWAVDGLMKANMITRIGYNQYVVSDESVKPVYLPVYSDLASELIGWLDTQFPGLSFVVLETLLLQPFLSDGVSQNRIFIQVDKSRSMDVFRFLQDQKYPNLMFRPSRKEYELYRTAESIVILDLTTEAPLIPDAPHAICIEKLLVDVFCDKMLRAEFTSEQFSAIVEKALTAYTVDKIRLHRYAKRRGKEDEIKLMAPALMNDVESERSKLAFDLLSTASNLITSLPESQQELFRDIVNGKLSQAEIARYYGVTPQAITNRINRLYKTILRRLESDYVFRQDAILNIVHAKDPISFIRRAWLYGVDSD